MSRLFPGVRLPTKSGPFSLGNIRYFLVAPLTKSVRVYFLYAVQKLPGVYFENMQQKMTTAKFET